MLLVLFLGGGILSSFYAFVNSILPPSLEAPVGSIGVKNPNKLWFAVLLNGVAYSFLHHWAVCSHWRASLLSKLTAPSLGISSMIMAVILAREAFLYCHLKWWQYVTICLWLLALDLCNPFQGSVCFENFGQPIINLHLFV